MAKQTQQDRQLKAWKRIKAYSEEHSESVCISAAVLLSRNVIEVLQCKEIQKAILAERKATDNFDAYMWSFDNNGMKQRLAFVNRQIRKLSKKVKK